MTSSRFSVFLSFGIVPMIFMLMVSSYLSAQDRRLRAGASISNITPPLGEAIVGNWNSPPATYIHDDLHARSLVLDDGEVRLVIVIVDNVSIKREVYDAAKHMIHHRTGIPMSHMMMAATHTHSGTSAGKKGSARRGDRKSTRLNSSHVAISYAVFCLKKKNKK